MKRLCTIKISGCEECVHPQGRMPGRDADGKVILDKTMTCELTGKDITEIWWKTSDFDKDCPLVEVDDGR